MRMRLRIWGAHLEDAADEGQLVDGVQQARGGPQRHKAGHAQRDRRRLLVVVRPPLLQILVDLL